MKKKYASPVLVIKTDNVNVLTASPPDHQDDPFGLGDEEGLL